MMRLGILIGVFCLMAGQGLAFQWEPFTVPPGDHSYVLEVRTVAEAEEEQLSTIHIDIGEQNGNYTVDTVLSFRQENVREDDLGGAMFGGSILGMFAFGPMMLFGPSFMMLPMMLMGEDIRVRDEPLVVMGLGRLYMDRTMNVAGRECVVLRFESAENEEVVEVALAEDLPFPCYARYGSAEAYTEVRVLEAR